MLLLTQPGIWVAFWAASTHCWLMSDFSSTNNPLSPSPPCSCAKLTIENKELSVTLRHQFVQKAAWKSVSGGNLLREGGFLSCVPSAQKGCTHSYGTSGCAAFILCQLLCELLGSLLLGESLGWCLEEAAPGILRAWGLSPALPGQPQGREGSFTLPSGLLLLQLDAVCSSMNVMLASGFFFFNLKRLVKTLKQ